jgi:hypothetical protein
MSINILLALFSDLFSQRSALSALVCFKYLPSELTDVVGWIDSKSSYGAISCDRMPHFLGVRILVGQKDWVSPKQVLDSDNHFWLSNLLCRLHR